MQNPLTQYPKPPFKQQHQESPGLACKMEPRPDHGETSYKGSGKLAGRKALITGGDSGIGRAAAIAFAREGADVAFGYLPVEQPDADEVIKLIRDEGRKVVPLPGDIRDEKFCKQLVADAVDQLGGLDILVSNAAKQVYQESLLDITTEQLDATFRTNVYAMVWITQGCPAAPAAGGVHHLHDFDQCLRSVAWHFGLCDDQRRDRHLYQRAVETTHSQGIRVNGVAPGPIWTPLQPSGGQSPENLVAFGSDCAHG